MGAWKDILIDMQDQQAADDWCRYEVERDEARERRRVALQQAWQLHRAGMINLKIAEQYRAEAREIRRHWR